MRLQGCRVVDTSYMTWAQSWLKAVGLLRCVRLYLVWAWKRRWDRASYPTWNIIWHQNVISDVKAAADNGIFMTEAWHDTGHMIFTFRDISRETTNRIAATMAQYGLHEMDQIVKMLILVWSVCEYKENSYRLWFIVNVSLERKKVSDLTSMEILT